MTTTIEPTPFGSTFALVSTFTPDRSNYITLPTPQVFSPAEALSLQPSLKYFIFKASWSLVDENRVSRTHTCYLSWAGQYTQSNPAVVSIPSHLGDSLKIPRGTMITLQLVIPPTPTQFLSLTPLTPQDYSIAEINKEYITNNLLSLVSLINLQLPLRLWVRGSLVTFTASLTAAAAAAVKSKDESDTTPQPLITLIAPNTMVEIVTVKPQEKNKDDGAMSTAVVDGAKNKAKSTTIQIAPKIPNLLVTVVPLPSPAPVVNNTKALQAAALTKHNKNKNKKSTSVQAAAPSPLSAHLQTGVITNSYEEPDVCDGTIYTSPELFQMLGYDIKASTQSTKPSKSKQETLMPINTILPIVILRTDRRAKPTPIQQQYGRGANVSKTPTIRLPNQDLLEDLHIPFPTPIEPFFNNVISINKIAVHPHLKGFTIALHSLQRHSLLLPAHCKLYVSPFHPYLGQVLTNTTLLPFIRNNFRLGFGDFTRSSDQMDENDYIDDTSILRLTHVPPSSNAEKIAQNANTEPLPTTLLSIERQQITSMDYKSLARPPLRVRHIQFCLKSHIEHSEPIQLPKHWIELSFYMYLSSIYESTMAKLIKKNNATNREDSTATASSSPELFYHKQNALRDYLVFGPSTVLSIPLYVSNATYEQTPGLTQNKETTVFTYQRLSSHCLRQIPCLIKNKPKGGYRGHYPHYITHRNQDLLDAVHSDGSDDDDIDEDDEDDDGDEKNNNDEKKEKNPKTLHPVDSLFWYTGVTISILAAPQQDSQRVASFVTLQVQQIEHQPFKPTTVSISPDDTITATPIIQNNDDIKDNNVINTDSASVSNKVQSTTKKTTTEHPIMSVFLTCSNVVDHPTLSTPSAPVLTPLPNIDILTSNAIAEATQLENKKIAIPTVATQGVTTLPSRFKVNKFNTNKYYYQEEESDEDELLDEGYTAENQLEKRRQNSLAKKNRALAAKDDGDDEDCEEDEDDYDEDDDEDDDEDEETTFSPTSRLLGKFQPTQSKPKTINSTQQQKQQKALLKESKKHNHSNIDDDDFEWDEEDHKEEMAYFNHFVNHYKQKDALGLIPSDSEDDESNDFDEDQYEYDHDQDCYWDVYGNQISVDEYEKLANGNKKTKRVFTYTQRYRFSTPTKVVIHEPILLPQLTSDTWQTFCQPSPGDEGAENTKSVQKTTAGAAPADPKGAPGAVDPQNIQTAAARMMQGGSAQPEEEEEEPPDPAVLEFMANHAQLLLQRPYMITEQQLALINEHVEATITHLDASLSIAFPFNQQVYYPSIQNPQVLHIPNSPLSGKPYVETLPTTTITNGDFSNPNPICIASPISSHMYSYLSRYPYSTTMLTWFDNLSTSLSLLQPYFVHLNQLSPYVAMQMPNTKQPNSDKYDITGMNESTLQMPIFTTQQTITATAAKASLITLSDLSKDDKIDIMKAKLPTLSGMATNIMTHGILYGSNKSGKTTSLCYLAHILSQHPAINAHVVYLDCTPYEEASVQIINVIFQHIFSTARLKHAPTVVILDNLDVIAFPHKDHEDNSVSEATVELLIAHHHQQLQDRSTYPTLFLAAAKHADALHPRIVSQLFPTYNCTIEPPTYSQRQFVILEQLNSFATSLASRTTKQSIQDRNQRQLDLDVLQTIINNTEGYTFPDISLLVHKIVNFMTVQQQKKFAAHIQMLRQNRGQNTTQLVVKDGNNGTVVNNVSNVTVDGEKDNKDKAESPSSRWGLRDITADLITKLTSTYVPLSLRGIGLSKPPNMTDQKKWFDVGALSKVIQTLRQTFEYPVLYPQLFNNSPLKLISGALIYGAPGSGKSILATALQFSCPKLHFIRVKGPEVLDKYVGASEDNVRKIFASARAAKPCVIFFDDFDSIALKRGSDSNGVTDRVVNQLLVEMDGVKGREGVFVLAATTHPELIDSALLRPGRLDLQLYCPLPETNLDREQILRAISGCNPDYRPKDEDDVVVDDGVTTTANTTTATVDADTKPTEENKEQDHKAKSTEEVKEQDTTAESTKTETSATEEAKDIVKPTKKINKKEQRTIQPPVQGAADYVYNTVSNVKKQYEKALEQHNTTQGHEHGLDTPQGRAIAIKKYKHRFPYVFADNVDFAKVAKLCKNFTGADMNALLTNALLSTQMDDEDDGDEEEAGEENKVDGEVEQKETEKAPPQPKCEYLFHLPILTTELLIQGYNMTPISLPESDRKKFSEAFKKFIQDKDQPEAMQKFDKNTKGRVAMAQ